MGKRAPARRGLGGRPPLGEETVVVRVGKKEYELTFEIVKMRRDAPFREVYIELVRKAEEATV